MRQTIAPAAPALQAMPGINALRADVARFRHLDRTRQLILSGLALFGMIILLATLVYAIEPAIPDSTALASQPAPVAASLPGQYRLVNSETAAPAVLQLQEVGNAITGTLVMTQCGTTVVTHTQRISGQILGDGSLSLTVTDPITAQATTTIYQTQLTGQGLDLTTQDASGHSATQHWARLTADTYTGFIVRPCQG